MTKQDYGTPPEFLVALKRKLGISEFSVDLACSESNKVAPIGLTEEMDSLSLPWTYDGWAFCNPPFRHIFPWVAKAMAASRPTVFDGKVIHPGQHTAMLIPASVGSEWWGEMVDKRAHVLFLRGRLTFVGEKDPYPKDCAVLLYTPFSEGGSYNVWDWRIDALD